MGSTLKLDDERHALVRERRHARIERKRARREARQLKLAQHGAAQLTWLSQPPIADTETKPVAADVTDTTGTKTDRGAACGSRPALEDAARLREKASPEAQLPETDRPVALPRRERDIAEFQSRRRAAAREARQEARARIARAGEPAAIADALAALREPGAAAWRREHEQLETALERMQVSEVGSVARHALWTIARDAARTSRRVKRDPELALAACVAYAVIAQLPRTAVRSSQRSRPAPRAHPARAFWR